MTPDEVHHRFTYHPPLSRQRREEHAQVRDRCERLAMALAGNLPPGRELSLAITKLEEVMFWANAALARAEDLHAGNAEVTRKEEKGKRAYAAYGEETLGKTHDGRTMPEWEDLGETIQAAWIAAAIAGGER